MKTLAIVTAINEEYKSVKAVMKKIKDVAEMKTHGFKSCTGVVGEVPVTLIMTSMGRESAQKAAKLSLKANDFWGVLIVGYCGGLKSHLKIGEPVLATEVLLEGDKTAHPVEKRCVDHLSKILLSLGVAYHATPLFTANKVIQDPKEKNKIFKTTGAQAVDMEIGEIFAVARSEKLPFLAMKVVIDDAATELPDFNTTFEKKGRMDNLSLGILKNSEADLMKELKKHMKIADKTIHATLEDVVIELSRLWK